ncbi:hypothetical protein [Arthrobacter sp. IK3]|uniref:hypothetical protein n=1 Tax=Arthrobacter sp. IK3 TaxID=3448169 RepID=UPI003EE289D8
MSRKAIAEIEAAGGTFEEYGARRELRGYAALPPGKAWVSTGCHSIAVNYYSDRPAGWKSLLEGVRLGTEPCTVQECDICAEDGACVEEESR